MRIQARIPHCPTTLEFLSRLHWKTAALRVHFVAQVAAASKVINCCRQGIGGAGKRNGQRRSTQTGLQHFPVAKFDLWERRCKSIAVNDSWIGGQFVLICGNELCWLRVDDRGWLCFWIVSGACCGFVFRSLGFEGNCGFDERFLGVFSLACCFV